MLIKAGDRQVSRQQAVTIALYVLPSLILVLVFWGGGFVGTAYLSLHKASLAGGVERFVGAANYQALAGADFVQILVRTAVWVGVSVPLSMALGTIGALLLNKDVPFRGALRALVYIPWLIPESLTGVLWKWFIHPAYGMVNNVLIALGIISEGIGFLGYDSALWTAIAMRVWRATPFALIAILAGLQAIPKDIFEAAEVDGARGFQVFRYITAPLLKPVTAVTSVLLVIWTAVIFDQLYVLTGGGPAGATTILPLAIFVQGFEKFHLGMASAIAIVGLAILAIVIAMYQRLTEREARQ